MTKEDNEYFENFTKYWICDNNVIDTDVKVKKLLSFHGKI